MVDYPEPDPDVVAACVEAFKREQHSIKLFGNSVKDFFADHPELSSGDLPVVHSVKARAKSEEHLAKKILRKKVKEDRTITVDNLWSEVTDLFGVRVLHLHLEQFREIQSAIHQHIDQGHWLLFEPPNAYTWDPEFEKFFGDLGIATKRKDSNYTSVHYVVRPNNTSKLTCEIQIRTLFEEVWGEIDHSINYPTATTNVASLEQIQVMAKIVGAGSRLASAIFRTHGQK